MIHFIHGLNVIIKALNPECYALYDNMALLPNMQSVYISKLATGTSTSHPVSNPKFFRSLHRTAPAKNMVRDRFDTSVIETFWPSEHVNLVGTPQPHTC